jgi:hypothetical protein
MESAKADPDVEKIYEALPRLKEMLPRVAQMLGVSSSVDIRRWENTIRTRVIPRFSSDFPLLVAICGGGNSGKSTLFNSLVFAEPRGDGQRQVYDRTAEAFFSPTKATAGLTRRVLLALHLDLETREGFMDELFKPLGAFPELLVDRSEMADQGPPRFIRRGGLPRNIVLMDTPDFDVGTVERFLNRDQAERVLEACDVLIYLFTNATYKNRESTRFLKEVLTGLGQRNSVLVYRVTSVLPDEQVLSHAQEVAKNLYGPGWPEHVLGVYRTHESDEVAGGNRPMSLLPVGDKDAALPVIELLQRQNPLRLRREQLRTTLKDLLDQSRLTAEEAECSLKELVLYRDSIRVAQSHCVLKALEVFPFEQVFKRLQEIFESTAPWYVQWPTTMGKGLRNAWEGVANVVKAVVELIQPKETSSAGTKVLHVDETSYLETALDNVEDAAGELRQDILSEEVKTRTSRTDEDGRRMIESIDWIKQEHGRLKISSRLPDYEYRDTERDRGRVMLLVGAHRALNAVRDDLKQRGWDSEAIREQARLILTIPDRAGEDQDSRLQRELEKEALEFRERMGGWSKAQEAFFAMLGLVSPSLGIAYVLATGDPIGGHAITGLFGLHDLAAVLVLPGGAKMDEVRSSQINRLLVPIQTVWFEERKQQIGGLFEKEITGPIFFEAGCHTEEARNLLVEINSDIATIERNANG